jgi:SAM-dependent methyltransferase
MMDKQVFWNTQHAADNDYWLTRSDPESVIHRHGVWDIVNSSPNVIFDVGVGDGRMSRYLAAKGQKVIGIDISPVALGKLSCQTYTPTSLSEYAGPGADLAICHLVIQHCSDKEVIALLTPIVRVLHSQGILSVQFACWPDPDKKFAPYPHNEQMIEAGLLNPRSPERMAQLVAECRGTIRKLKGPEEFPHEGGLRWYIAEIIYK